jgi:histidyl-tRNA synthetase
MANAPTSVDTLDKECRAHFDGVLAALENLGIDYIVDPFLVRGLDYYTRTVFEFKSTSLGAQDTVCGGGRYDGLIAECGGQDTASVGFGMGIERLLLIMEETRLIKADADESGPVFIGYIGEKGKRAGAKLAQELRREGIPCEYDIMDRGVKAQMKRADKLNSGHSIIVGDDEVLTGRVKIKDMRTGEAAERGFDEVTGYFKDFWPQRTQKNTKERQFGLAGFGLGEPWAFRGLYTKERGKRQLPVQGGGAYEENG